jgi:hypothetical protein
MCSFNIPEIIKSCNLAQKSYAVLLDPKTTISYHLYVMTENADGAKKVIYAGIFKKIDDIPALRIELENLFNRKTHKELVEYCLLLGRHVLEMTGIVPCAEITESFEIIGKWLKGETGKGFTKFQSARNAAGRLLNLARAEKDPITENVYRIMAQIANSPHVKTHALWASDYTVKLINKMFPNDLVEVKIEREMQIKLMERV